MHLEQNRELQRLQDEGRLGKGRVFFSMMGLALHLKALCYGLLSERKLDTYRQTAKTQEKVCVLVLGAACCAKIL